MDKVICDTASLTSRAERDDSGSGAVAPSELPSWSSGDAVELAARLAAQGRSQREIGALWGVSANAVQKRLKRRRDVLGREVLWRLRADGPGEVEIAGRFGVAEAAIAEWVNRPGECEPKTTSAAKVPAPRDVPAWKDPAALDVVRSLRDGGWTATEIGGLFGVSGNAVRKRLGRAAAGHRPPELPGAATRLPPSAPPEVAEAGGAAAVILSEASEEGTGAGDNTSPALALVEVSERNVSGCRWPLWGHGERPTHQYCGKPVVRTLWPGVYCDECRGRAFHRRTIMEDAAT